MKRSTSRSSTTRTASPSAHPVTTQKKPDDSLYRRGALDALRRFGIVPGADTDPQRLRDLLNALYVFEIRDLKLRHKEKERVLGPQPAEEYRHQVLRLKARYSLLTVPPQHWLKSPPRATAPPPPPPRVGLASHR